MRSIFWIIWSVVWLLSNKIMMAGGLIYYKSFWGILFDCIISCFAAWFFCRHKWIRRIGVVCLVLLLISRFSLIAIFCFVMNIMLLYITKALTPTAKWSKEVATPPIFFKIGNFSEILLYKDLSAWYIKFGVMNR